MDYHRENGFSNGNVVQVFSGNNLANELFTNEAIWATEDDYRTWNSTESSFDNNSNSNYDGIQSQSSEPPNKRSRNLDLTTSNRSKAIGKMFYKTKLCCKFRGGTCPYITNCNFAHSIEELRKPPPNWQEIVADNQELPREEYQIPILGVSDDNNNNSQRSYKGRHCKKFYTEEGCPYGESCTFLHDENSRARESVAISLGPSGYGGNGSGNGSGVMIIKPSNWKTKICNKWEITGYCPFGNKCHFAHGNAELSRFGGGQMDSEAKDSSVPDQRAPLAKTSVDNVVANIPHSDGYHIGVQSQRLSNAMQKIGPRSTHKWKGPDKISKIYGDWIDDFE